MRKIYILVILSLFLLSSCIPQKSTTTINGIELTGEVILRNVEIHASNEKGFVEPDETILFKINAFYEDEEGITAENIITDEYIVEISNEKCALINEDNSVTINEGILSGNDLVISVNYKEYNAKFEYVIRKNLENTIDENGVVVNTQDYDVVVNKVRALPSDYIPDDLVKLQVPTCLANPEVNQLREIAADSLEELFAEAKTQGYNLVARSGYRSYQTQKALYNSIVRNKGQAYADKYSAKPGTSEHQTGLAIDITCPVVSNQLISGFGDIDEGIWVKENAHKFGFVIRYPQGKKDIVGYEYEPWHLRYVGIQLATKIYDSGLTVEEYFIQ